jgi:hypothetical protein
LPIFLVTDDTLQEKFGIYFECLGKLFDHARQNGSNYMNDHYFVDLILKIPSLSEIFNHDICFLLLHRSKFII